MEPRRSDYIPSVDKALALPTPELAMCLLRYLVALEDHFGGYGSDLSASHLRADAVAHAGTWPEHTDGQHDPLFLRAISEAWWWLVANGLLARRPGHTEDMFVTRTGRGVAAQPNGLARLQAEQRLGVELHPRLAGKVRNQFLLGDAELAVFAAMKEVEVRVRELVSGLGVYPDSLIGVDLMKRAFNGDTGLLRDPELVAGERDARMALFWGAIGVFKNPISHRPVNYENPTVAVEAILLADLLLRMLDDVAPLWPPD
jgi:uncharacterized protein (TIGR02391 family)